MGSIATLLGHVARNRKGAAATVFALSLPVLLGAGAMAIDVSLYRYVDARMQTAADAAVLAAISQLDTPANVVDAALDFAERNVPENFGTVLRAEDVEIGVFDGATGEFTVESGPDVNAVRVMLERSPERGNGVPRILSLIWGTEGATVRSSAIAARQLNVQYQPPERYKMDSEAGDFNEVYAYCFNYKGTGPAHTRRSQEVLISNNMPSGQNIITISGGVINKVPQEPLAWPQCQQGESLSFRMRNIRHAKSMPDLWKSPNKSPRRPEFNYYTDTVITDGKETFSGLTSSILETKRCDTLDKCDPSKPGNVIPKGKNRTPHVEGRPCIPGSYMYFGWEDRPPGQSGANKTWTDPAWTDRDYDDIVFVMRCPRTGRLGDGMARLVG